MREFAAHKRLCANLQHTLLDDLNSRKRKTRDQLFLSLGYDSLLSKFVPPTESQIQMRTAEVVDTKSKLLNRDEQRNVLFSHCSTETVSSLCKDGRSDLANDATVGIQEAHHRPVLHGIAVLALYMFTGYVPEVEATARRAKSYVKGSIFTLARSAALVRTVVSFLSDNAKGEVGVHHQKLFQDTLPKALHKALCQLIWSISKYVQFWAPSDFVLPVLRKVKKGPYQQT